MADAKKKRIEVATATLATGTKVTGPKSVIEKLKGEAVKAAKPDSK